MASGVARTYNAFYNTYLNKIGKILKLITGILTFLVGLIVIIITFINICNEEKGACGGKYMRPLAFSKVRTKIIVSFGYWVKIL